MARDLDAVAIMEELKKKVGQRSYPDDVEPFIQMDAADGQCGQDDHEFYMPYLEHNMKFLNEHYYIDYHAPITGKFKNVKRIIKRLYRFHLEPISDRQNDYNTETVYALNQVRNFIAEQLAENIRLKEQLTEIKMKLEQLEGKSR